MSALLKNAESIFEAAQSAAEWTASTDHATNWSILVSHDGAIHMVADSDWSLEALRMQNTATSAYRIHRTHRGVTVEARSGSQKCVLESAVPDPFLLRRLAGFKPAQPRAETWPLLPAVSD